MRVARLLAIQLCLIAVAASQAQAQTAVSACGQIVSGDAYLTNDLDCAPNLAGAVIVEGGRLDLGGFTIRGGEIGVLCARPIWEEGIFIYRKCHVFGGTIANYELAGVAAKKLELTDVTITGGRGIAVSPHKSLRFANLVLDVLPEPHNLGILSFTGTVKGTNLSLQGGVIGIHAGRKVDIDGMVASGSLAHAIRGSDVRLRNAILSDGGAGVAGGKKATIESSTITGHADEGVSARRIKLVGSTVTGNGLDLLAEKALVLDGSTCGTSNGLGVCSAD